MTSPSPYRQRHFYGQTLEPQNGILHGAGQDPRGFDAYCRAVGPPHHPTLFMTYCGLKNADHITQWGKQLRSNLTEEARPPLIPQIGLSMTRDGHPETHYEQEVANGHHDEALARLADALRSLERPSFLRIGYEFNGSWNGYQPESFIAAWRYVVDFLRKEDVSFASVWCWAKEGDPDYHKFYPGDDVVDWWGIDLFSIEHLDAKDPFYDDAHRHRKPVMIGESTARFVGVHQGETSWNDWFVPYFTVLQRQPGIKAFCYINWDWASYPQWHDWGDCRLQLNQEILERYQREMQDPVFLHQGQEGPDFWTKHRPAK